LIEPEPLAHLLVDGGSEAEAKPGDDGANQDFHRHTSLSRECSTGRHQRPWNSGERLSMNAAIPSRASADVNRRCCSSRSSASPLSSGISSPVWTARLMWPTAREALLGGQNPRASSRT